MFVTTVYMEMQWYVPLFVVDVRVAVHNIKTFRYDCIPLFNTVAHKLYFSIEVFYTIVVFLNPPQANGRVLQVIRLQLLPST
jgi:hypothetical protein